MLTNVVHYTFLLGKSEYIIKRLYHIYHISHYKHFRLLLFDLFEHSVTLTDDCIELPNLSHKRLQL